MSTTNTNSEPAVLGLKHICVHTREIERSMDLYTRILGFDLVETIGPDAERDNGSTTHVLRTGALTIHLVLPAPGNLDSVQPIGNTNHNHFMLNVDEIGEIGDQLKAAGYELENEEYRLHKYTFFEGPNGEIVGLRERPS